MSPLPKVHPKVHPGVVLFALAVGSFAIGTTEFAAMSLLPYFSRGLNISEPVAGHVISAYALGVVVGAPTIAILAAKLSRRTLLIGLMIVFGIANGLSALAPDYHTMLLFRFLSGLPHGAYFGVAALVGASLVANHKRAQAVSLIMIGLTVATVIGVPAANALGQAIGWRWGFGIVAGLAALTVLLIALYAPQDVPDTDASPLRELGALKKSQVWLTLGIGAIGFGGMFAVYTYVASTLLEVTHVAPAMVPVVLCIFGIGMTAGTLFCGWAADKPLPASIQPMWTALSLSSQHSALMPMVAACLLWSALCMVLFVFATPWLWAMCVVVFMIGCGGGLGIMLQTRLMDVAGEAQTLAAALNHSAFNTANALGPYLAGMAVAAGYGFPSAGWVGCALTLGGLLMWVVSVLNDRRKGYGAVEV
ncbi:MFS transporter [Asticcacaulis sp. BYS171W]|uniref:MFS transporter n=1 Tax=Asticcacaulis aquaticus TaxID=2984212 RepID=A0ABT5HRR3_9CAUL|nr:MFS transporter [Asticcacaulis aquaticus]MDC7682744.1 MFS transporter [Asticcacaulis aquaticus]